MSKNTFEEKAARAVDWWRAADGGLTHAAEDVIWLGGKIDSIFAGIESGEISPQEAQDVLWRWQWNCRTGTEADIVGDALEYLSQRYIKPKIT